jgi:anthranilate phosphoribosyltransferase
MIDAFELLAARRVQLSIREVAIFGPLVHPVHAAGRVFGWEVKPSTAATM